MLVHPRPGHQGVQLTTAGVGPKCTFVRCFAVDSFFYLHTQSHYLTALNLRYVEHGSGATYDWDYTSDATRDWIALSNPCDIPAPSAEGGSTSAARRPSVSLLSLLALVLHFALSIA